MEQNLSSNIKIKNNIKRKQKILNKTKFIPNAKYNSTNVNINNAQNLKNKYSNNNNIINFNNNLNNGYIAPDSSESSLSTKIYEKNIILLNDKIKEQENNIIYLNNRLKNYDITIDEIAKLNIELNKLNAIIRNKNNTINDFREIADLSKHKIEKLIKDKNELIEKINFLEDENKNIKKLYQNTHGNFSDNLNNNYNERKKNSSNIKYEDYNQLKYDLNEIIRENKKLKSQINEKDNEIKNLKIIIDKLQNEKNYEITEKNNNVNDIDYKEKKNIIDLKNKYKINEQYIKEPPKWKIINSINKRDISIKNRSPTPLNTNIDNKKFNLYLKNDFIKNDYSFKTEPNNALNLANSHSKRLMLNFKNKYNYLKNKYNTNPLDYSNYLLDNLHNNIIKNYNK